MRNILLLFSKRIVVLMALVIFCGPIIYFDMDKRVGVLFMGIIFALAGAGNIAAHQEEPLKGVRIAAKVIGGFLLAFGVLVAVAAILLLVAGRPVK